MKKIFKIFGILFIIGLALAIIGFIFSKDKDYVRLDLLNSTNLELIHEEDLENIKMLNVNLDSGRIQIEKADTSKIEVYKTKGVSYEEELLQIDGENLTINTEGLKNRKEYVQIILQLSDNLDEIDSKVRLGEIDLQDQSMKKCNVKVDAGNIVVANVKTDELYIVNKLGDVDVENIETEKFIVDVDAGEIISDNVKAKDTAIKLDNGSVEVDMLETEILDVDVNSGSAYFDQIKVDTANVKLSLGEVIVYGDIKDIESSVNAGQLNIWLAKKADDYRIDANVAMGEVNSVDNHTHPAEPYGKVVAGVKMGQINLFFDYKPGDTFSDETVERFERDMERENGGRRKGREEKRIEKLEKELEELKSGLEEIDE